MRLNVVYMSLEDKEIFSPVSPSAAAALFVSRTATQPSTWPFGGVRLKWSAASSDTSAM